MNADGYIVGHLVYFKLSVSAAINHFVPLSDI